MPTYEYECLENGHRFDVKQSFSDDKLTECIECGEPVRKIFSAAGIVFKGSGYYVTDSRSSNGDSSSSSKSDGDSSSKDSGSSSTSKDSSSKDSSTSSESAGSSSKDSSAKSSTSSTSSD